MGARALWSVVAVAAIVVLGGCTSSDGSEVVEAASGTDVPMGLDGPVMRHQEPHTGDGEDAEIGGVVAVEGDCLYLSSPEGTSRILVVWPARTSWDAEAGRVLLANGDSVGPGDTVHGGGGYRPLGNLGSIAGGEAADLARRCLDDGSNEIAVVNNQVNGIAAGERPVDNPPDDYVDIVGLDGDWLVSELWVDGKQVELDPSWPITVTIDGEVISGIAACNQYGGTIDWSYDAGYGRFVVSELSWTERACESPAMMAEQSFLDALQAVDSYETADGLHVGADAAANFHLIPAG